MWQRKQTFLLVVVAFSMIASILFPTWEGFQGEQRSVLFPLHYSVYSADGQVFIYFPYALASLLAIASATLGLISIGKFRNRLLQIKLGALNSLFMTATIGTNFYFTTSLMKDNQIAGTYGIGLFLPAVAILANMLANWLIRRDEKKVRDADRLR